MSKPILIDTHAHVNFNSYNKDGDEVIKRTLKENVWIINSGAQYSTSKRAIKYAEEYKEGVYATVGLHPMHIYEKNEEKNWDGNVLKTEHEEFDEKKYRKLLENLKVVAIGEIGLDYINEISEEDKEKQKEVFIRQLDLARQVDKPVVLHCRKAYNEMLDLLEMFNFGCVNCQMACAPNKLRGVSHCFVGRWSQAEKLLEIGFHIGFNGIITYSRDYDKVIKNTPLNRILLETDCPYLAPEPHRGERNEPLYIKYVAEKIAKIKRLKFKEVSEQTTKNTRELFGI